MKISTCFSFFMLCLSASNAWQEFGRRTYTYEKPTLKRKQVVSGLEPVIKLQAEQDFNLEMLRQLEEVIDSDVEVMSFSMSMSSPSSSATRPPAASFPTAVPTLPPSFSSSMPSDMPSLVPSSGPTPSTSEPTSVPTITPAPSTSSTPSSSVELTDAPSSPPLNSNAPSPTVFDSFDGSSPSSSATRPPAASFPTAVPTLSPSFSSSVPSDMPSLVPSSGPTPSTSEPTSVPTITPAPSTSSAPSSSVEPTGAPSSPPLNSNAPSPTVFDNQIFQCDGNRVALGEPGESTVSVFLTVGYLVESTSNNTNDFVGDLENALFRTALLAALECQDNTLNRRLLENHRKLLADTTIVDNCDPEVPQAVSCHYMETDLVFWVNHGEMTTDTADKAAYAGYMAIRENMENGSFLVIVPTIVRLEYLSPLPLFVPPAANGGDQNGTTPPFLVASRDSGSSNVSPWTIGACVATIMGGLISMVVWSRNRQNRRQHVHLLEEEDQEDPIYLRGASRNAVTI